MGYDNLKGFPTDIVQAPQFPILVKWASEAPVVPGFFYNTPEEWDGFMRNAQLLLTDQISADKFAKDMQKIQEDSQR